MFKIFRRKKSLDTSYNIDIDINPSNLGVPKPILDLSTKAFRDAGFSGEMHVDLAGRLLPGFDQSCPIMHAGKYDIFSDFETDANLKEIARQYSLTASGNSDSEMQLAELAELVAETLGEVDELSGLPWNIYRQLPMVPGMEINTPAGIQGMHVHTDEGIYLRFFKPNKEDQIYDYDALKEYLLEKGGGLFPRHVMEDDPVKRLKFEVHYKLHQKKYSDQYKNLVLRINDVDKVNL